MATKKDHRNIRNLGNGEGGVVDDGAHRHFFFPTPALITPMSALCTPAAKILATPLSVGVQYSTVPSYFKLLTTGYQLFCRGSQRAETNAM